MTAAPDRRGHLPRGDREVAISPTAPRRASPSSSASVVPGALHQFGTGRFGTRLLGARSAPVGATGACSSPGRGVRSQVRRHRPRRGDPDRAASRRPRRWFPGRVEPPKSALTPWTRERRSPGCVRDGGDLPSSPRLRSVSPRSFDHAAASGSSSCRTGSLACRATSDRSDGTGLAYVSAAERLTAQVPAHRPHVRAGVRRVVGRPRTPVLTVGLAVAPGALSTRSVGAGAGCQPSRRTSPLPRPG